MHFILNRINMSKALKTQIGCNDLVGQLLNANTRSSGSTERANQHLLICV
jgi:hypothetical protein